MPPAQRYLTMATVVLGSSLYGTALLTTSTILPQMQGALSATQDEIAWVMTFNILATAVVTPMTGWLVSRFGTRRVVVYSIGLFTLATLLCGMAQSLEMLVLWRILQGGAGAPIVPLSQSILFNTFPRRQHTMVMSVFGMAVAVAPAFGPVIGGYLAEMYSWRWSFYMLVPIGVCATIGMSWTLPPDNSLTKVRFDWTGFIALATALAAVQLVLARGVRLDWFDSMEIVIECLIAGLAFYIFLVHSLSAREPFLNLKLLADRNYAIGLALVTIYGMLNFTPMVLLPPLLQQQAGYPDALVGQVIGCRGVGMLVGFMTAGFMSRIDPRISMAFGFGLQTLAGLWMLTFDLNVTMEVLVINSVDPGLCRRHRLGADYGGGVRHAGCQALRRGLGSLPPLAQYRLELLHLAVDCRDRAHIRRQLQPHDRDDHALQPRADDAGHDRGMEFRHGAGTCASGEGNPAPGDDDRLSERLHDVHGDVGACRGFRPDGQKPQGVMRDRETTTASARGADGGRVEHLRRA